MQTLLDRCYENLYNFKELLIEYGDFDEIQNLELLLSEIEDELSLD